MNVRSVCVLGGTGFVGRHIVSRLISSGRSVKVLSRRPERYKQMLVLPGVRLVKADMTDADELKRQFQGVDAVINLIGILNEKAHDGSGFRFVHTELTQKVLEACKANNVKRLLHMSALNADAGGPSHYLRTKGEAENHLHTFSGPVHVTSFRPSVIFGPKDSFINRFAGLLKLSPLAFPLACPNARFAPVYVGDVADAFVNALEDKSTFGRRYDLCGPHEYTLKQLVQYTAKTLGLKRWIIGLPNWISSLQASVLEFVPGKPFSVDNFNSLKVDSVCKSAQPCPTSLESVVPYYLGKRGKDDVYQELRRDAGR